SLHNLAALLSRMHDHAKAEPLLKRALNIRQQALGPNHPQTAASLSSLGALFEQTGDWAQAESLYQGALKIAEETLGPEHPDTAIHLKNLASLCLVRGDSAQPLRALDLARQSQRGRMRALNNILTFASERQRLNFLQDFDPYSLLGSLGRARDLLEAVLTCKG